MILFKEGFTSNIEIDAIQFSKRNKADNVFDHPSEPVGDCVLEVNNEILATGGFLLHYNMPFADLYMEVKEKYLRHGLGATLSGS